jgi:hypothetical protein
MAQFGFVPEIIAVKADLQRLKANELIREWELPYEEILTRLSAAIFFLTPMEDAKLEKIWKELEKYQLLNYRENTEKKLSRLSWRVEFNGDIKLPV